MACGWGRREKGFDYSGTEPRGSRISSSHIGPSNHDVDSILIETVMASVLRAVTQ